MRTKLKLAALPLLLASGTAYAQDAVPEADAAEEEGGPWTIEGGVGLHSDYRFRGISLSDKDPEVTAELSVSHESGLYAGVWASNVALNGDADDLEVDLIAGYAAELGAVTLDIGGVYYLYPGNSGFNYGELLASVGTTVGPASFTVGVAYAPSQDALGNEDNTYVYVTGELPIGESPLTAHATFGYEDGAFADKKKDWLIGVDYDLGAGFTATLDYVDTARAFSPLGDATVVARIGWSF